MSGRYVSSALLLWPTRARPGRRAGPIAGVTNSGAITGVHRAGSIPARRRR